MKKYYEPKHKFIERIREILDGEEDIKKFFEYCKTESKKAIRINTLKISVKDLIERLKEKGWKIKQPFKDCPEILIIENELKPGEIGNSREHILGYYYVQEITSMMPVLVLNPDQNQRFLDLCAAPGSKTTQAAAQMKNKGSIIANDLSLGRISILSSNLERCGVMNTIVTRHPGNELCIKLNKLGLKFDRILVDAPCSGEGNIRGSPKTFLEWSEGLLKSLSKKQKRIAGSAVQLLKDDGEMIYSTCTYSPEENEEVVQWLLDNYNLKIIDIKNKLPKELKTRPGLNSWKNETFDSNMCKAVRIYHHDNDLEGFFICCLKKKPVSED